MEKFKNKCGTLLCKASPALIATSTTMAVIASNCVVLADAAEDLLTEILGLIGLLAFALAVVFAAMGAVSFAASQAEGDGPAKTKAIGQIAAAILLIAVGIALRGDFGTRLVEIFTSMS